MLRDGWFRRISGKGGLKFADPTSPKGDESTKGVKHVPEASKMARGSMSRRKGNSPKISLRFSDVRVGAFFPLWLSTWFMELQMATRAIVAIYVPRNPTKVLLWTFISAILIHFSLWASGSFGAHYGYRPELAIGAIGGWLYMLNFLRAFRPIGHFIVSGCGESLNFEASFPPFII